MVVKGIELACGEFFGEKEFSLPELLNLGTSNLPGPPRYIIRETLVSLQLLCALILYNKPTSYHLNDTLIYYTINVQDKNNIEYHSYNFA